MKDICRATEIGLFKDGPGVERHYVMPKILIMGLPIVISDHRVGAGMGFGSGCETKAKMVNAELATLFNEGLDQLHQDMLGYGFPIYLPLDASTSTITSPLRLGYVDIGEEDYYMTLLNACPNHSPSLITFFSRICCTCVSYRRCAFRPRVDALDGRRRMRCIRTATTCQCRKRIEERLK